MKYVGSCTDSALDYSSSWDQALPAPRTCTENCVIHFIYCAGLTTQGTNDARPQYSISFPLGLMLLYVRNNWLYIVTPGGEQIKSRSKVLKKKINKRLDRLNPSCLDVKYHIIDEFCSQLFARGICYLFYYCVRLSNSHDTCSSILISIFQIAKHKWCTILTCRVTKTLDMETY